MAKLSTSDLHKIFDSLDQNRDGLLSLDELNWLLERIGVHADLDELAALVGKLGMNFDEFSNFYESVLSNKSSREGNRSGNFANFGESSDEEENKEENGDLYKAFKVFDLNGDGLISSQELQNVLWRLVMWDNNDGGLDCDKIMRKYDVNNDGFVDFDEFKRMMLIESS